MTKWKVTKRRPSKKLGPPGQEVTEGLRGGGGLEYPHCYHKSGVSKAKVLSGTGFSVICSFIIIPIEILCYSPLSCNCWWFSMFFKMVVNIFAFFQRFCTKCTIWFGIQYMWTLVDALSPTVHSRFSTNCARTLGTIQPTICVLISSVISPECSSDISISSPL